MKPLSHFAENHPLATGAVGVLSGIGSALAKALHIASGVLGDLAVILGFGTALVTFLLMFARYRHEKYLRARDEHFIERRERERDDDDLTFGSE